MEIPAGAIPERKVRELTPEEQAKVRDAKLEALRTKTDSIRDAAKRERMKRQRAQVTKAIKRPMSSLLYSKDEDDKDEAQ